MHLVIQDTCALSRHIVLVRCNLLEPGQGARRSTDCTSHCRCGHPVVPLVPLAVREAQPVHFATRYPFYRCVLWVMSPRFHQQTIRAPTLTYTHTLTHSLTHTLTHVHTHSHTLHCHFVHYRSVILYVYNNYNHCFCCCYRPHEDFAL